MTLNEFLQKVGGKESDITNYEDDLVIKVEDALNAETTVLHFSPTCIVFHDF
jgi:hypothetical protein